MKLQSQMACPGRLKSYLLLECMLYISMVMVLVGLMLAALYRSFKHSTRLHQATSQIIRTLEAGERWRAEVRSATSLPYLQEEGGVSWLHLPQPTGEVVYAIYEHGIWRQTGSNTNWVAVLGRVKSATFEPISRSHVQAWRWELELEGTNRPVRVRPLFTFQAVPGFALSP